MLEGHQLWHLPNEYQGGVITTRYPHSNMRGICLLFFAATALSKVTLAFVSPRPLVGRVDGRPTRSCEQHPSQKPFVFQQSRLYAEESPSSNEQKSNLPFFLDPGTKGGALFLSLVLFVVPIIFYNIVLAVSDVDELDLGRWIGVGFTAVATVAWLGTYLFRVVTKDMTYVSFPITIQSCHVA